MHLMIDQYAVRLDVEQGMLQIHTEEASRRVSFYKLKSINLLKPGTISSRVLELAAEHQLPVMIYNPSGRVAAWCWSHKYGSIAEIRKKQVYFCDSDHGKSWIIESLKQKEQLQQSNLKWLKDRVKATSDMLDFQMKKMQTLEEHLSLDKSFDVLRGYEGSISRCYWGAVSMALKKYTSIPGRDRRQPRDQFNKCLNYLYGILYGLVESSLLMTGLDPYIGIMHVIRHDEPTLAYDHIEVFRPWADRLLMELFMKGLISDSHFNAADGLIEKEGRLLLINTLFEYLNGRSVLNGKKIKRMDHIHYASQMLANRIRDHR